MYAVGMVSAIVFVLQMVANTDVSKISSFFFPLPSSFSLCYKSSNSWPLLYYYFECLVLGCTKACRTCVCVCVRACACLYVYVCTPMFNLSTTCSTTYWTHSQVCWSDCWLKTLCFVHVQVVVCSACFWTSAMFVFTVHHVRLLSDSFSMGVYVYLVGL